MKQYLHKLFSVLLSLVVLFSTFSFTVESHYCGEKLVDVAIFSESEGCEMEPNHKDLVLDNEEEACCVSINNMHCKDVKNEIQGEPVEYFALEKSALQKVFFVTSFIVSYQNRLLELNKKAVFFNDTFLLQPKKDRVVLFESFRI